MLTFEEKTIPSEPARRPAPDKRAGPSDAKTPKDLPAKTLSPGGSGFRNTPVRTVLVVDDNVDAADSLASLLRAWGHVVVVANDGPSALAALQDLSPDLALLDIGMPDMDGYELAAHLRFQPGCEEMPVIAITGFSGVDDLRRSRQKGFAGHLVKPVDPESLARLLG